jgi:hypothetical protein
VRPSFYLQTITLKTNANFGPGTFTSAQFTVDPGLFTSYQIDLSLQNTTATMSDPTTQITISVERLDPEDSVWKVDASSNALGTTTPGIKGYRNPFLYASWDYQTSQTVRVTLSSATTVRFAASVTLN